MLIQVLSFVVLFTFSSGCKKDSKNTTQNFMRFTLNGTHVGCDKNFGATYKTTSGPDANITFHAGWDDNALDFQLFTYTTDISGSFDFVTGVNSGTGLSMTVTDGLFDIRR